LRAGFAQRGGLPLNVRAGRVTWSGMKATAQKTVTPQRKRGRTENDYTGAVRSILIENGCLPMFDSGAEWHPTAERRWVTQGQK
jgi:hypothetical protein